MPRRRSSYEAGWVYTPDPYLIIAWWCLRIGAVLVVIAAVIAVVAIWAHAGEVSTVAPPAQPIQFRPLR